MSGIPLAVKKNGADGNIDYDFIVECMNKEAAVHEAKATATGFRIPRWWHNRKARAQRSDAAMIRRIQARLEGKKA